jgi:hypothetical protein
MPLYTLILAFTAAVARAIRKLERATRPRCCLKSCNGVLKPSGVLLPAGNQGYLCEHACAACGARMTLLLKRGTAHE